MKRTQLPSSLHSQQGSAIIEFLVTALPVLLLGLGATETARWYIHKQHIRFALHEAQRIAAVTHAEPTQLITAFEEALNPLFAPAGPYKTTEARRAAYLQNVSTSTSMPPWRISIISPNPKHFEDFQQADLEITQSTGFAAINNNYQFEQHQEKALGIHSQETIYQANILSVQLIYPYKPLVPGVSSLMKQLSTSSNSRLKQSYYTHGYLPLELTAHISMQSHPVMWPAESSAKIVYHEQLIDSDNASSSPTAPADGNDRCAGLWCIESSSEQHTGGDLGGHTESPSTQNPYESYRPPQSSSPHDTNSPSDQQNAWAPDNTDNDLTDDPLCDTSLCCT